VIRECQAVWKTSAAAAAVRSSNQQVPLGDHHILGVSPVAGLSQQVPFKAAVVHPGLAIFAISAAQVAVDHHPLADGKAAHPASQGGYLASAIRPRDVRVLQLQTRPALADPDIHAVQGGGPQPDQDFSGTGLWVGQLPVLQDFRSTVTKEIYRFHRIP
jgi:hypothetical protein